jgi:cytochrome c
VKTIRILGAAAAGLLAAAAAQSASAGPHADAAKGKAVFAAQCSLCHSTSRGVEGAAPSLAGVVGRKAGSEPGFPFTKALKSSGLTWTKDNLEKFLAGPGKMVPGTAMPISLPKDDDRDNVVAYLATLKK